MTNDTRVTTIIVNVRQQGAYLIAHSADVPGLQVWGENQEQLCERVMKAIKLLFKWNRKLDVTVFAASDPQRFPEVSPKECNSFVVATA